MIARYFGMDIHKEFAMIAAVDVQQQEILAPIKVPMNDLAQWAAHHLTEQDQVALEVTNNAWAVYDDLVAHAGHVVVANPYKTRLIAEARIKSDKVDALVLAKLLASRFIADVWVPEVSVRQQRALSAHRTSLRKQLTQCKNRIHAILRRHNLDCPENDLFTQAGRAWLSSARVTLSPCEQLQLRQLLAQLDLLQGQFDETDRTIAELACHDQRVTRLMQITGIGYFTAFAVLAIIGDIQRFPTAKKLSAYAGLVPSLHQSGSRTYLGSITKTGSPPLRWLMVEAAHSAVRWDPYWQQVHDRICHRRGPNVATVAVARKLLVVIWHLLHHQTAYYHLLPEPFVRKLQNWAYRIGRDALPALSSLAFVQNQLAALDFDDLAANLTTQGRSGRLCLQAA